MENTMPERALKPKQSTTISKIEEALIKALRTHPECEGIRVRKIVLIAEPGGVANWDAQFEADGGERPKAEQRRVLLATKLGLQKRLDLAKAD